MLSQRVKQHKRVVNLSLIVPTTTYSALLYNGYFGEVLVTSPFTLPFFGVIVGHFVDQYKKACDAAFKLNEALLLSDKGMTKTELIEIIKKLDEEDRLHIVSKLNFDETNEDNKEKDAATDINAKDSDKRRPDLGDA